MRAQEGTIRQERRREIEGGMKSERPPWYRVCSVTCQYSGCSKPAFINLTQAQTTSGHSLDAASKMCCTLRFTSTCLDSYYPALYLSWRTLISVSAVPLMPQIQPFNADYIAPLCATISPWGPADLLPS